MREPVRRVHFVVFEKFTSVYFFQIARDLSDYANTLSHHLKKRYLEKISCVGIDPVLIPDKTYDPECLSPVESMDRVGKIETSCSLALTAFASSNSHAELTM